MALTLFIFIAAIQNRGFFRAGLVVGSGPNPKPSWREEKNLNFDITCCYHGDTKAAVAFTLGLLLTFSCSSKPSEEEEYEVVCLNATYHYHGKAALALILGLIISL